MRNLYFFVILAVFGLSSCATNNMTLRVVEPAPVFLAKGTYRAGVIDRTKPTEKTKNLNRLDKILSAEGVNLDKEGAAKSIEGVMSGLMDTQRFQDVSDLTHLDLRTVAVSTFPEPLDWAEIDNIGVKHNVNIVFALEMYDTDTRLDYKTVPVTIKGPLGVEVPAVEHHATMRTAVKTGWRIYNLATRQVIDQLPVAQDLQFTGKGINPATAVANLLQRKEAVKESSRKIGYNYSQRIMPFNIRVRREYFVKGSQAFKIGRRKAQTGNWAGAAEVWNEETDNPKAKIAGRAWYNMAISSEINGDVPLAIEWAQGSYENYGTREALRYVRVLRNRQAKNQVLDQQ